MDLLFQFQIFCEVAIFLAIVFMNVLKKNTSLINAYLIQSMFLVILLSIQSFQELSFGLFFVTMCMFVVKVLIAPQIFRRFVKDKKVNLSASTYLNIPITLGILALLNLLAQSDLFSPFFSLNIFITQLRMLLFGSIFMSLFLTINRKGVLSQIIGVLSLENCIFAFGHFLGIQQAASLEVGILFDVFFWVIVSSIFIKMIYKHYGSLDVSLLRQLKK